MAQLKSIEILQCPANDNGKEVIVKVEIDNGGKFIPGIGTASPNIQGYNGDTQFLFETAVRRGIDMTLHKGNNENLMPEMQQEKQGEPVSQAYQSNKPHNTHAGSITSRQMGVLTRMTQERGKSLDTIAQDKFGISPDRLSSSQGNELIQSLVRK